MITEDYVSFEIAKLLKEKGFSENTIYEYADVGGITEKWYDDYRERVLRFDWDEGYLIEPPIEFREQYEIIGDTISAPTYQMARKWLREIHDIDIMIWVENYNGVKQYVSDCWKNVIQKDSNFHRCGRFSSYNEACEAAIKYCLENLI